MADWKDTLNLPRTGFPMKANLPTSEPEMLERWAAMDLYGQIRRARRGAPRCVLHDGPPYANGQIHLGTALAVAEVEYEARSAPSIYVEFPLTPDSAEEIGRRIPGLQGRDVSVLIWTTTPWTSPSNLAIAFHPDFDYAAYEVGSRV